MGGAVLYIETQPWGSPRAEAKAAEGDGGGGGGGDGGGGGSAALRSTGQLGEVMRESSQIAHTFARSYLSRLEPDNPFLESTPIHVHVPEGATPKDGPSAGVTMVTSFLSLALDRQPRSD